jgi:hypothetical protein
VKISGSVHGLVSGSIFQTATVFPSIFMLTEFESDSNVGSFCCEKLTRQVEIKSAISPIFFRIRIVCGIRQAVEENVSEQESSHRNLKYRPFSKGNSVDYQLDISVRRFYYVCLIYFLKYNLFALLFNNVCIEITKTVIIRGQVVGAIKFYSGMQVNAGFIMANHIFKKTVCFV